MLDNIWILVRRRNENYLFKDVSKMLFVCLAVVLSIPICLADDDLQCNQAMLMQQIEENIQELRQAKQKAEREEREKNSLVALSDEMIKDSFQSSLQSKMDILYDNHTDLTKELQFNPTIFNCGKEFDIFKLLDLAKAHRNITTEPPKCIEDLEEAVVCPNGKPDLGPNGTNNTSQGVTPKSRMFKNTVLPPRNVPGEVPPGVVPNPAAPTPAVSQAAVSPAQHLTDKKGDAKPAERPQQPKTIKANLPESKSYLRSKVIDGSATSSAQMVGARGNRAGARKEHIIQQNEIVAKPAAAVGPGPMDKSVNTPANDYGLAQADQTQLGNSSPQLAQIHEQLPQAVKFGSKYIRVQEYKLQTDKQVSPVMTDSLQQQQIVQVAPATQAAAQPEPKLVLNSLQVMEPRQQTNKTGEANQIVKATGVVASEQCGQMLRSAEQKVQTIAKPATGNIQAQLIPQAIKNAVLQISEKQAQSSKPISQADQNPKILVQPLEQQTLRPTARGSEQLPANVKAEPGAEQLSLPGKLTQTSAQQQVLKQILTPEQQAAKPAAAVGPAPFQQANKPASVPVHSPAQQLHLGVHIQQPLPKQPSVTTVRVMGSELTHVVVVHDKTPLTADVATERSIHQSAPLANSPQIADKKGPDSSHVWGYNMFPYTARGHIQNMVSEASKLENREPSGNLQNNPKVDYGIYQD